MLQEHASYPAPLHTEIDLRIGRDYINQAETSINQPLLPPRNKSVNIIKLPFKPYKHSNNNAYPSSYPLATEPSHNHNYALESARE